MDNTGGCTDGICWPDRELLEPALELTPPAPLRVVRNSMSPNRSLGIRPLGARPKRDSSLSMSARRSEKRATTLPCPTLYPIASGSSSTAETEGTYHFEAARPPPRQTQSMFVRPLPPVPLRTSIPPKPQISPQIPQSTTPTPVSLRPLPYPPSGRPKRRSYRVSRLRVCNPDLSTSERHPHPKPSPPNLSLQIVSLNSPNSISPSSGSQHTTSPAALSPLTFSVSPQTPSPISVRRQQRRKLRSRLEERAPDCLTYGDMGAVVDASTGEVTQIGTFEEAIFADTSTSKLRNETFPDITHDRKAHLTSWDADGDDRVEGSKMTCQCCSIAVHDTTARANVPMKKYSKKWFREKQGKRWTEDFSEVMLTLRALRIKS